MHQTFFSPASRNTPPLAATYACNNSGACRSIASSVSQRSSLDEYPKKRTRNFCLLLVPTARSKTTFSIVQGELVGSARSGRSGEEKWRAGK
jgi:hypothetical protein